MLGWCCFDVINISERLECILSRAHSEYVENGSVPYVNLSPNISINNIMVTINDGADIKML